jgi:ComF family protein
MLYQEDGLIGKILHNFKYNFVQDIADVLNKLVKDYVAKEKNDILADLVVPVPLHKRRYAERGFNQAEIVAGFVAKALNISCVQALQRGRYTVQQAKLSREERLKNVVTAFQIVDNARKDIYGKRVILVDDVLTTGSTMQECAKVLKECGVVEVIGVTIARG